MSCNEFPVSSAKCPGNLAGLVDTGADCLHQRGRRPGLGLQVCGRTFAQQVTHYSWNSFDCALST